MDPKFTKFFNGLRSENTRKVVQGIIEFLQNKKIESWKAIQEGNGDVRMYGWVRSREVFNKFQDQNPRTITRLLDLLKNNKIIDFRECQRVKGKPMKGQPGAPPVFYRVREYYDLIYLKSREELIKDILNHRELEQYLLLQLRAADELFKERTGDDLAPLLDKLVDEYKRSEESHDKMREMSNKLYDPCKTL